MSTNATPKRSVPARDTEERHNVQDMHAPIMREQAEPRDGFEPIPPWMSIILGVLVFWGGWYVARYSGDFRGDVFNEAPPARNGATPGSQVQDPPEVVGKRLFGTYCVACHKQDGLGVPGQYPPLAGSEWVTGPPARLKRILLNGLTGPVTVKGEVFGKENMPAWGDNGPTKLKDDQIAAVLTFLRQKMNDGAGPITPEEVAATRAAKDVKGRAKPWTAEELLKVPEAQKDEPPAAAPKPDDKGAAKSKAP